MPDPAYVQHIYQNLQAIRYFVTLTGVGPEGTAFYLNGMLSPDVYLVRGRTYVFVVETGLGGNGVFQPVYFTTDSAGGYQGKSDYQKRVRDQESSY